MQGLKLNTKNHGKNHVKINGGRVLPPKNKRKVTFKNVLQRNGNNQQDTFTIQLHKGGNVPPRSHGRAAIITPLPVATDAKIGATDSVSNTPITTSQKIPRHYITRSERMIDRLGRLLASQTNVHVAVALDKGILVISANKEFDKEDSPELYDYLKASYETLKGEVAIPPLPSSATMADRKKIKGARRDHDMSKFKALMENQYDDIEDNPKVKEELKSIKKAIEGGIITDDDYMQSKKNEGIYFANSVDHTQTREQQDSEYMDTFYNVHGEQKVTYAINKRREIKGSQHFQAEDDDVYIGGTLTDCYSCNVAHKVMNQHLQDLNHQWKFYSGGTHGYQFPNWRKPEWIEAENQTTKYEDEAHPGENDVFSSKILKAGPITKTLNPNFGRYKEKKWISNSLFSSSRPVSIEQKGANLPQSLPDTKAEQSDSEIEDYPLIAEYKKAAQNVPSSADYKRIKGKFNDTVQAFTKLTTEVNKVISELNSLQQAKNRTHLYLNNLDNLHGIMKRTKKKVINPTYAYLPIIKRKIEEKYQEAELDERFKHMDTVAGDLITVTKKGEENEKLLAKVIDAEKKAINKKGKRKTDKNIFERTDFLNKSKKFKEDDYKDTP